MDAFTEYVLGFLFTPDRQRVVLMRKARPEWQRGRLNGVGGRIEEGETPKRAMEREAHEETGVMGVRWEHFATIRGESWCVFVFRAFDEQADEANNIDDEPVICADPLALPSDVIPNLRWLVPLAMDTGYPEATIAPVLVRYVDAPKAATS